MKSILLCAAVSCGLLLTGHFAMSQETSPPAAKPVPKALDFEVKTLEGKAAHLKEYQGKVVLIVNVASYCGNTPQYATLEKMYQEHKDAGLVVLGFPSNQFGAQEPGTAAEIREFCEKTYGVKFPMFEKVDVNGDDASPLFKYLTAQDTKPKGSGRVTWNFEKFLLGRNGEVIARFDPRMKPDAPEITKAIEVELAKKAE